MESMLKFCRNLQEYNMSNTNSPEFFFVELAVQGGIPRKPHENEKEN